MLQLQGKPVILQPQNKYVKNTPHRRTAGCGLSLLRARSVVTAAISYHVEVDGTRRKQALPSRVMFLNKTHTEADNTFNGTLDLRGQNQETCIKLKAKLKVKDGNRLSF